MKSGNEKYHDMHFHKHAGKGFNPSSIWKCADCGMKATLDWPFNFDEMKYDTSKPCINKKPLNAAGSDTGENYAI